MVWVAVELSSKANYRNRGTEFIKSPEMLLVANASKKEAKWYDRRKRQGAGEDSGPSPLSALPDASPLFALRLQVPRVTGILPVNASPKGTSVSRGTSCLSRK